MSHQNYANGRMANLLLYIIGMFAVVFSCFLQGRGMTIRTAILGGVVFIIFILLAIVKPGNKISERVYAGILCVAMAVMADALALAFQSIDTMLFVFLLQTFFAVMFLDKKIFWCQIVVMCVNMILWSIAGAMGHGIDHMRAHSVFGFMCLIAAQWLSYSIIRLFVDQRRRMQIQEQSVDDMLRLLTVKCREYQDSIKRRMDFLSNMSHEMRTPANSILGMNEMILRESKDEHVREYAGNIYKSGQYLVSVINDILDFSKIEVGKLEIEPEIYNMFSLLQDVIMSVREKVEEKKLLLNLDIDESIPVQLYGDDVRFRQVLINLLSNAVKYTNEGSVTMVITARRISEFKVSLYCEVKDTGIGIKEENLPRLFDAFQTEPEQKHQRILGTGLGVAVTSEILELMESELKVESEYGAGSKFYFVLVQDIVEDEPIGDIHGKLSKPVIEHDYQVGLFAPGAKILIVDDNEINRKVFCNLLKQTGAQISQAPSGRKCLEMVRKEPFHLIFLDHMMPGMNGIETFHTIREEEGPCQKVPIIALTANAVPGVRESYLKEGFDDYLAKPILPNRLEEMVRQFLPKELLTESAEKMDNLPEEQKPAGSIMSTQLPEIDGVFWGYAMSHFPNEEMLLASVEDFYQLIPSMANKLQNMYEHIHEEGVLENYKITVHGMKSSASLIGAMRLSGCAGTLEMASMRELWQLIEVLTPIFLEDWRSYEQKLALLVAKDGESESKEKNDEEVIRLLEAIQQATEILDLDCMDDSTEKIGEYVLPEECEPLYRELQAAVTNLDTDLIKELIERMINYINE